MKNEVVERVETLYGTIVRHAKERPDHEAIIVEGNTVTYNELLSRIDALRDALCETGASLEGKRVYISDSKKIDLIVGVVATIGSGGVAVLAAGGGQAVIDDCRPAWVYTGERPKEAAASGHRYITPTDAVSEVSAPGKGYRTAAAADPAMILYTSGTTSGTRRGAILTHGILSYTTDYMNQRMEFEDTVREYVVSPLDHSFGFARCRAVFRVGGTLVFDDGMFNPARVLMSVDRYRCNSLTSVSAGIAVLLKNFEKHLTKLGGRIRWAEIGSLPLSVELKRRMLRLMPSAKIFMHYGLTEASRTTLLDLRRDAHKLDSVGIPAPDVQVRISDAGEILVHGPNVALGYWGRQEEWRQRCRDGWLHTGDLGRIDEDGFLYVQGRKDDVINVGGEKFLPKQVEDEIVEILSDSAYCIIGVPDPEGLLGEIPVLAIEGEPHVSISDVREFLKGRVPDYTIPKRLFGLDAFPRTANGKIQRQLIRREAMETPSP